MSGYFGLGSDAFDYDQFSDGPSANLSQNTVGNGVVTKVELLVNDSSPTGNVKLAIYEDVSGVVGDILLDCGETSIVDGWTVISGLNLIVTLNTYYWLANVLSAQNTLRYDTSDPDTTNYYTKSYGSLWDATWPTGTYENFPYTMRAWVDTDLEINVNDALSAADVPTEVMDALGIDVSECLPIEDLSHN